MRRFLFIIGLILLFISLAGVAILSTRGVATVTWVADLAAPTGERVQNTALEGQAAARSLGERLFDSPAQGPALVLIAALGGALAVTLAIALWQAGRVWRWLVVVVGALLVIGCAVLGLGLLVGSSGDSMAPMSTAATPPAAEEPAEAAGEPAEEEPAMEASATVVGLLTPTATNRPESTLSLTETAPPGGEGESGSAEGFAVVEAEWPDHMGRGDTGVVRIQLERRAEGTLEVTVEVPGNVGEAALIEVPEGATGSSLEDAFGPDYRALAVANLESAGFEVRRSAAWAEYQPLSRERVQWAWLIDPQSTGSQVMVATITGLWEPVDEPDACAQGSDSCIERELWYAILETRVHDPLVETGQLDLLSIVTGVLGSSVSIPWLVERVQGVVGRKPDGGMA
jgi:hypothetical protein